MTPGLRQTLANGHLAAGVAARMRRLNAAQAAQAARMSEAGLMLAIRRLTRIMGHRVYHTARSDRSDKGFPDLVIAAAGGIMYRELKTETGKLTCEQLDWLCDLRAAGADADVWRPGDLLAGAIQQSLAELRRTGMSIAGKGRVRAGARL